MAEEDITDKIDLSGKGLKKLEKAIGSQNQVTILILDDNELQRLDNVGTYAGLQRLSAVRNQLIRMYGVSKLLTLSSLNLAHNNLVGIEGLKELVNLRWLCLAGNNVKAIDHLNTNINLEHLDLSENNIGCISDLSHLKNLKELLLHGNRISGLQFCQRYLPMSLESLSLADNRIADLNEVCHVSHLPVLREFTIAGNPCVAAAAAVASHPHTPGQCVGFDYRPFVINWCMNLRVLDGYPVDAKESLRAEWLYSQGKGRSFRVGEQEALIVYLSSVCPPLPSSSMTSSYSAKSLRPASAGGPIGGSDVPEAEVPPDGTFPSSQPSSTLSEEDRKLLLILSKAQLHQRELREQRQKTDKGGSATSNSSSAFGMSSSYSSVLSSSVGCSDKKTPFEETDHQHNNEVGTNGRPTAVDNGIKSRPSTAGASFASPFVRRRVKESAPRGSPKRCSSRSSCSREQHHLRRYSSAGGEMVLSSSYNVELPVTLYGEDAPAAMVTSLDGGRGGMGTWGGRGHKDHRTNADKDNLMTRSLDPSLLSCHDNDADSGEAQERGSVVSVDVFAISEPSNYKPVIDVKSPWTGNMTATSRSLSGEDLTSNHRPKKLFSQTRVGEDPGMTMESSAVKEDCNLEELTEDGNENPLQTATKLVPVPESIVSPEYRPQASYMPTAPTASLRQGGHVSSGGVETERRRGQGWASGGMTSRTGPSSGAGHCCAHTQPNYFSGPNYSAHQPQSAVGLSSNQQTASMSSPGTRRANQSHHQQHHSSCSSTESARCRHSHSNMNAVHSVGTSASSSAARGPPPIPSYYPTSTPNATGSPSTTRHACHVSSYHHNHAQSVQASAQSRSSRRGSGRSSSMDVHTPHSPATSRVLRTTAPSRGAKIRKPTAGEVSSSTRREGVKAAVKGTGGGKGVDRGRVPVEGDGGDSSGDNTDSEMSISKLEAIKCVAVERRHRKEDAAEDTKGDKSNVEESEEKMREAQEKAVLKIQSLWRGYRCRNGSKTAKLADVFDSEVMKKEMRAMRMEDHIRLLSKELEATRGELGKERKLRLQQMEAIKSLWKEAFSMQNKSAPNCLQSPVEDGTAPSAADLMSASTTSTTIVDANVVAELSRTCTALQGQVQHLQDFLKQVMQYMASNASGNKEDGAEVSKEERVENVNAAIQTYISAVMTPQGTGIPFPFGYREEGGEGKGSVEGQANGESRPSYLPIFGEKAKKATKKRLSEEENDSEGGVGGGGSVEDGSEEQQPADGKEATGEEDSMSKEMQHYVEGLVDGVLKSIVTTDEEEEEKSENASQ